jgi:glycine betaine catabolism B
MAIKKIKIKEIINETHDTKTFRFDKPKGFKFISGQFCTISFTNKEDKELGSRPFTYSSNPKKDYFDFTIKKMGDFTTKLFAVNVGEKLTMDGPKGEALNFDEKSMDHIVYICGGSGITPAMSLVRNVTENKLDVGVAIFYGNQTKKDIIFFNELNKISRDNKKIHIFHVLSKEDFDWNGDIGYINQPLIEGYIDFIGQKEWFICGPPAMNKSILQILKNMGIKDEKIHFEKWELAGKSG